VYYFAERDDQISNTLPRPQCAKVGEIVPVLGGLRNLETALQRSLTTQREVMCSIAFAIDYDRPRAGFGDGFELFLHWCAFFGDFYWSWSWL